MIRRLATFRFLQKSLARNRINFSSNEINKSNDEHIPNPNESDATKLGGFAQAYEKQSSIINKKEEKVEEKSYTFGSLLRNSKLIDLGDPAGKVVLGKIFHVVEDDLYIDFGWKFHCVCTRPNNRSDEYVRGAKVKILIKDLELSSLFLGSTTDLTLLEADCKLLGIVSSPVKHSLEKKNDE